MALFQFEMLKSALGILKDIPLYKSEYSDDFYEKNYG